MSETLILPELSNYDTRLIQVEEVEQVEANYVMEPKSRAIIRMANNVTGCPSLRFCVSPLPI
jgi:hypothetical protein